MKSIELLNDENETETQDIKKERRRIEKVLSLIPQDARTILDVGCRNGEITNLLSFKGKVLGIDLVGRFIERCKLDYPYLEFMKIGTESLNKKFDLIFLGELIEHQIDPEDFLRSLRRLLNTNGKIILTTPNIACLQKRIKLLLGINPIIAYNHLHEFTQGGLRKICEDAGYEVEVMSSNKETYLFKLLLPCPVDSLANSLIFRIKKSNKKFLKHEL